MRNVPRMLPLFFSQCGIANRRYRYLFIIYFPHRALLDAGIAKDGLRLMI